MVKSDSKYIKVIYEGGFNVPLDGTYHLGKEYITLEKGDVVKITKRGIHFLSYDNSKDLFIENEWLYSTPEVISDNINNVIFRDVTKEFNRNKAIDTLLEK